MTTILITHPGYAERFIDDATLPDWVQAGWHQVIDAEQPAPDPVVRLSGLTTALGGVAPATEHFLHTMAGVGSQSPATTALATRSLSGHPLTWTQNPTGSAATGILTGGGGAFYTLPGAQPTATYVCGTLASVPTWGRIRFGFMPGSTPNGTACIGIPSQPVIGGTLTMKLHYRTTRTHWALAYWQNGGEHILAEADYLSVLPAVDANSKPIDYTMSFRIDGAIITFRTADGVTRQFTVTNPTLFASLGGSYLFAESYDPASTDDIVAIETIEGGSPGAPIGLVAA